MANSKVRALLGKDFALVIDSNWTLPEMIENVVGAIGKHIGESEDLKRFLNNLPEDLQNMCPNSSTEELQKYIATRYGKIDKSDARVLLAFMKNFVSETALLERLYIACAAGEIRDVEYDELVMLSNLRVPAAIDNFWYRWFETLVVPFESLNDEEKKSEKKRLKTLMNEYDYTVFIDGKQLPWAQAFPEETQELTSALSELESNLKDPQIKKYLKALINAHNCKKIKDLEKVWTKVDHEWIKISPDRRVFPVHGIESGYEHPYGVSPEWRIMLRLDFGREDIEEIRNIGPQVAGALGADADILEEKLKYTDVGVFYTAVWAGMNMNFRGSGQSLPNRQEVLRKGGKVFMDLDSSTLSVERYISIARDYISKDAADTIIDAIDALGMVKHTAGHEVSHPAGRTGKIDTDLGDALKLLEEAKATMSGNLMNEAVSEENRLRIIAETIPRFCRFFFKTSMENPTSRQYVWENMVACRTLHKAGVIRMGDNCIEVDIEKAKSRAWFIELEKFIKDVFTAYKENDAEKLEKMHKEFTKIDGIVAEVIALVNK